MSFHLSDDSTGVPAHPGYYVISHVTTPYGDAHTYLNLPGLDPVLFWIEAYSDEQQTTVAFPHCLHNGLIKNRDIAVQRPDGFVCYLATGEIFTTIHDWIEHARPRD